MKFPLRTLVIDDEQLALNRLRRLLSEHTDTFIILAEGHNGQEGLELIEEHRPDLIFLDIEMPLLNGFEMLAKVTAMPMVVFATAYDQYAIRAFEENSVDYLLKPIEHERLLKTLEKIRSRVSLSPREDNRNPDAENLLRLLEKMQPRQEMHSISVKSGDRILLIPLAEVSHFEAEDKYVFLNTLQGQQYLVSQTLTVLEEKLASHFLRISRSIIVNTHHISEIQRYFNGKYILVLRDKKATSLQSGTTYGEAIRHLLAL
jgi:two-component system, LytTR family, response regulator